MTAWDKLSAQWAALQHLTPLQLSLVTAGTFVVIALVIYLVGKMLLGVGRNRVDSLEQIGSKRPLALGGLTEAFAFVVPVSPKYLDKLRHELQKAGYYHRKAVVEFLGLRNAAVIAWLFLVGAALVLLGAPEQNVTPTLLAIGGAMLLLIHGVPRVVLSAQAAARCQRIQYGLPDALDMITMTVAGGLPLRESVKRVSAELAWTHPDVACELKVIDLQTETGSFEMALQQFGKRIDVPDVVTLSTMVRHAEKLGGQVADAFREFADSIRRTRRQRAEERGNKASIKLLFPVVFFLAPPIYILLLGPAAMEMKTFITRERQPGGALSQGSTQPIAAQTALPPGQTAEPTPAASSDVDASDAPTPASRGRRTSSVLRTRRQ